jgi:diguanylate cyclase (GGDEF)-like protein
VTAVIPFDIHIPTLLLLCTVMMLSAALIMSFFGLSQRVHRGYRWWVAAMWLAAAGGALQCLRPLWPGAVVPGNLLLLAWPVLLVTGLRQFHSRERLPTSHGVDLLLFAFAYLAWLATWASPALQHTRTIVFGIALALIHVYAGAFVARLESTRHSRMLQALFVVMLAQALAPLLVALSLVGLGAPPAPGQPLLAPLVVVPGVIAILFSMTLCLALMQERTERDLRETQRQLRVLADTDMLTQVPNRRHFEELAAAALGSVAAGRAVLMLFDIDHFKRINDSLGHAVGDEALRRVARCARETLRTRDVLGRVGGDEFMLLLPGAAVDDALLVAERITRQLDAERPAEGPPLALSLSFGVVDIAPGESLDTAQRRADLALYEAKRQGRRRAVRATQQGPRTVFEESRSLGLTPS